MNGNVKRIRNTEWNILFYIRSTVTEKVIPQIEKRGKNSRRIQSNLEAL